MLLFRPPLMRFGRPGIVPGNFAAGGDEPSPLDNDLPSLTDRASAEWLWVLLAPLPASGTTHVNDDGGYALESPADGIYTQVYRGLVMPLSGAPEVYESTITTTVGGGASEISVGLAIETDTAFALTLSPVSATTIAVGLAIETDTALSLPLNPVGATTIAVGLAVETATALALKLEAPLPFEVETGSASPTAESYASVADADLYHASRGNFAWAEASENQKQIALRSATDYMVGAYGDLWAGYRATATQALDWPRYEVPIRGLAAVVYLPHDEVPAAVRNACALLALKALAGELLPDLDPLGSVLEETVGPISVKYAKASRAVPRYSAVDRMLAGLLAGGGGIRIVRA